MIVQCPHCDSRFFKTLEIRVSKVSEILYKKRCKRCKRKALFRKNMLDSSLLPLNWTDWQAGQKVSLNGYRAQVFVSEYSRKISRPAEMQHAYLQKVQQAEEHAHGVETSKTAG